MRMSIRRRTRKRSINKKHNRKSIRIKNFDYSSEHYYFITICCQNRALLFGKIELGNLVLNNAGTMINDVWAKLPNKFPHIKLHNHIVMPNHFHGVIEIIDTSTKTVIPLHQIVQWFKTMTTNFYIKNVRLNSWTSFNGKLWQRNYYEHVVRNEKSLIAILEYINSNPKNWLYDQHYE